MDRRAAVTAGADPADLRRPRLLTVARRGGDVRALAERATRSAPRDHARRRDTAAWRSAGVDHAVPRRTLSGGHARCSKKITWTRPCVRIMSLPVPIPATFACTR